MLVTFASFQLFQVRCHNAHCSQLITENRDKDPSLWIPDPVLWAKTVDHVDSARNGNLIKISANTVGIVRIPEAYCIQYNFHILVDGWPKPTIIKGTGPRLKS